MSTCRKTSIGAGRTTQCPTRILLRCEGPDAMPIRSSAFDPDDDSRILAAIVESSDDAIIAKNLDGIVLSWNRGAERMYGYSASEAIGRSISFLVPAELDHELV